MKNYIVFEHFKKNHPRKPGRLWDILTSGRVLTCVRCGAFTQTSKKRQRVIKKKADKRKPWDGKCHRCGGSLANLTKFSRIANISSHWLFVRYNDHPQAADGRCVFQDDKSFFFQWQYELSPKDVANHAAINEALSKHVGRKVTKNAEYCPKCGEVLMSWHVQTTGSLVERLNAGGFLFEWLVGDYRTITFEDRAEVEGIPFETLIAALNKKEPPVARQRGMNRIRVEEFPPFWIGDDGLVQAERPIPRAAQPVPPPQIPIDPQQAILNRINRRRR